MNRGILNIGGENQIEYIDDYPDQSSKVVYNRKKPISEKVFKTKEKEEPPIEIKPMRNNLVKVP